MLVRFRAQVAAPPASMHKSLITAASTMLAQHGHILILDRHDQQRIYPHRSAELSLRGECMSIQCSLQVLD